MNKTDKGKKILSICTFENADWLTDFVNKYGITQENIQQIVSDNGKFVLFYWEYV